MPATALIFDCYTVEPSGLGVPPYLSSYVRCAYSALRANGEYDSISYATIDDFRLARGLGDEQARAANFSDPYTYSLTRNSARVLELLADANTVLTVAGDAVPSQHVHAVNGDPTEIAQALGLASGGKVLLGPLSNAEGEEGRALDRLFDARHSQTVSPANLFKGSDGPIPYAQMARQQGSFTELLEQIPWEVIAEIELYRGCTRARFCAFCNEPVKNRVVAFRDPGDVVREIRLLYEAGVRSFRLGQQTCFFSYLNRDVEAIERMLVEIREACPELEVLHIDNVDPLAAASPRGREIARAVAEYCTDGNCAPMGIESFDPEVVRANDLTCTPQVLERAMSNIEEYGAERGPHGLPKILPGLNIIYGLPGESRRTHFENMRWLTRLLEDGHMAHRTNVRPAQAYPGTPLASLVGHERPDYWQDDFESWKRDIRELWEIPMKSRVYPEGLVVRDLHSFFTGGDGTRFRRLGSYSIQVLDPKLRLPRYEARDVRITGHDGRFIFGEALAAA